MTWSALAFLMQTCTRSQLILPYLLRLCQSSLGVSMLRTYFLSWNWAFLTWFHHLRPFPLTLSTFWQSKSIIMEYILYLGELFIGAACVYVDLYVGDLVVFGKQSLKDHLHFGSHSSRLHLIYFLLLNNSNYQTNSLLENFTLRVGWSELPWRQLPYFFLALQIFEDLSITILFLLLNSIVCKRVVPPEGLLIPIPYLHVVDLDMPIKLALRAHLVHLQVRFQIMLLRLVHLLRSVRLDPRHVPQVVQVELHVQTRCTPHIRKQLPLRRPWDIRRFLDSKLCFIIYWCWIFVNRLSTHSVHRSIVFVFRWI